MKLAGFLFSFYLLLLAAIPCCLADNCPDDKTEQSSQHDSNDGDCGNCSPFFNCQSCSVATVISEIYQFECTVFTAQAIFTKYRQPKIPATSFDVWQPPKLG